VTEARIETANWKSATHWNHADFRFLSKRLRWITTVEMLRAPLVLDTPEGQVTILDEPTYSFGSAGNLRTYEMEIRLDSENLTSVHGVTIDGTWSAILGASGGPSTVHEHSAVAVDGRLYLAVGDQVVCLNLVTGLREWSRGVDEATCFGVYWESHHGALICHGELQISRLSLSGDKLWSATGADIFTEGFRCLRDGIEVIDFNRTMYLFDYRTGALLTHQ
jgi:outer membrane protein assembly factor BamB